MAEPQEIAIICHRSHIVRTISHDLDHFSAKFVEKGFVTSDVSSDIRSIHGVGNGVKATQLLDSILNNMKISRNKPKRFHEFISIFSMEAAYRDLAERMMETYHSEEQHSHVQSSSQSFTSSQYSSYASSQHKKCSCCCHSMSWSYTSRKYKGHHHHAHLQSYISRQRNQHHCSHSKFQTSASRQNNLLSHPHSKSQSYTPHSQNSRHILVTVSPRRKSRRNRSHPQYPRNRHCNTSHPHILQKIKVLNKRVLCHSAWRHKKKYISRVLCRRMRRAHLSENGRTSVKLCTGVQEANSNVFNTRDVAQTQVSYAGSNNTPQEAYPEGLEFDGEACNAPPAITPVPDDRVGVSWPESSVLDQDLAKGAGDKLVEKYESVMREKYSDLFNYAVTKLKEKLKNKNDYERFIWDMENRFSTVALDITDCSTALRSISRGSGWSYLRYIDLFSILKRYVGEEIVKVCDEYEELYNGHIAVKLISAKLLGTKRIRDEYNNTFMVRVSPLTTSATKELINDLWETVHVHFHLPKLDILLYDKTYGSLQLTWLIKADQATSVMIRSLLIHYMPPNKAILRKNNITHIIFNHETLYPIQQATGDQNDSPIMLYVKPDFQDELVSLFDFCLRNETLQIKISLEQHKSFGWLSFCQYYLRYDGRRLDDRLSLRYYGIKYGSVIDIVFLDAATQSPPPFKRQVPHLASFDCDVEEESPSQVKRKSALVHRLSRLFGSFTLFVMHPPQAEATNKVFSSQGTVAFEVVSEPHQKAPTVRKSPGKALTFSVCDRDLQTPDWAEHHVVMHERKSPWHHTFGTMYCIDAVRIPMVKSPPSASQTPECTLGTLTELIPLSKDTLKIALNNAYLHLQQHPKPRLLLRSFLQDTRLLDLHPAPQYPDQVKTQEDATEPQTTREDGLQIEIPTPFQTSPSPDTRLLDLHPAPQYPDHLETQEDATEPETTNERDLQTEKPLQVSHSLDTQMSDLHPAPQSPGQVKTVEDATPVTGETVASEPEIRPTPSQVSTSHAVGHQEAAKSLLDFTREKELYTQPRHGTLFMPAHPKVKQKKTQLDDKLKHGRHKKGVRSLLHSALNNINKVPRTVSKTDHNTKKDSRTFFSINIVIQLDVPFFDDKKTPITMITDESDVQSTKKSHTRDVVSAEGVNANNLHFESFDENSATDVFLNGQDIIDFTNVYAQMARVDEQTSAPMLERISKTKRSKEDVLNLPEGVQCNDYNASMSGEDKKGLGRGTFNIELEASGLQKMNM